jgi:hypothetical protein
LPGRVEKVVIRMHVADDLGQGSRSEFREPYPCG